MRFIGFRYPQESAMASTSVHIEAALLARLDQLAAEQRTSRNRLIVKACERLLEEDLGEWPPGFFSNAHLSDEELRELRDDAPEMLRAIDTARRSRATSPL